MKGFTLLEIILSVAIITIVATITPPAYEKLHSKISFDSTIDTYVSYIYRAQKLSQTNKLNSSWGTKIQNNKIILFKGSSFNTRDVTYDEEFSILSNIEINGDSEVVFAKLYGYPNTEINTSITNGQGNTKTIKINKKGLIDY